MKKILSIVLAAVGACIVIHSCLPPEIEVESVTLNKTSVTMEVGEIVALTATVSPADATFPEVTWETSDPSVISIKDGYITALKEGTAVLTATAWGVSTSCTVTVKPKDIAVASVSLDKQSLEMEVGDVETLVATVSPADATDKTLTWSSSNSAVALVSTDGKVVALAEGTASITVSAGGKFASCPVTVVAKGDAVESVEFDVTAAEVVEGGTVKITVTISPEGAAGKTVTWTSSDSSIATVDASGLVSALKAGTVVITASCEGKEASCTITITSEKVPVTGVSVAPATLSLVVGEKGELTATVAPENATEKGVTWSSDDSSVATVDENGQVTAVAKGQATITATTVDGNKKAACAVTVTESEVPDVPVTSVTMSKKSLTLTEGDTGTLTATVKPDNATDKTVTWTTSKKSVATVDQNGVVTAVKAGSATITATCGGKKATCTVTVKSKVIAVTGVSLSPETVSLNIGGTAALTATVSPSNATNKSVTWSSDKESVATVSDSGVVTAVAAGSATITVTTVDGAKTATCAVTVKENAVPVTSVSLSPATLSLVEGDTETITVTVSPSNATDNTVTWSSDYPNVASVDQEGKVTAISEGSTVIRVVSNDGSNKKAICAVTVYAKVVKVTGVSVAPETLTLTEGASASLKATVAPANATDKSVTWSSSDKTVATVNSSGRVTAVAAGSATITVTTVDGGKTATCAVTVEAAVVPPVEVSSVSLSEESLTLTEGGTASLTATVLPENADNKEVDWSSSDSGVATVDANGLVTAVAAGSATITVTTVDGGKTATCAVTVQAPEPVVVPVTSVTLNKESITLNRDQTFQLTATVEPDDATSPEVSWVSDTPGVAEVDATGKITAKAAGSAVITATADGVSATCTVTVTETVSGGNESTSETNWE